MTRQSTVLLSDDRHPVIAASIPAFAQSGDGIDYTTAHLDRKVLATRAAGPISVNGVLDEPAWANAPVAHDFIQNDPREGEPATYDTEVRVLYDDQAIYFGVFAKDTEPGAIIISDLKKDFNTGNSDGFRVIIDTFADQRNGYQFAINPAGAKWDAQMSNEGRENNANWDGVWDVRTKITETGWYAEIWIPFRTLKFRDGSADLGLNFERKPRAERRQLLVAAAAHLQPGRSRWLERSTTCAGLRPGKNLRFAVRVDELEARSGGQPRRRFSPRASA